MTGNQKRKSGLTCVDLMVKGTSILYLKFRKTLMKQKMTPLVIKTLASVGFA
jgi:hypothetical protein